MGGNGESQAQAIIVDWDELRPCLDNLWCQQGKYEYDIYQIPM